MRRLIIWAVLAAGMFLAMRKMADKAAPAMRAKCSEMCDRILECVNAFQGKKRQDDATLFALQRNS